MTQVHQYLDHLVHLVHLVLLVIKESQAQKELTVPMGRWGLQEKREIWDRKGPKENVVHLGLEKLVIKVYLEEKVHLDLMVPKGTWDLLGGMGHQGPLE